MIYTGHKVIILGGVLSGSIFIIIGMALFKSTTLQILFLSLLMSFSLGVIVYVFMTLYYQRLKLFHTIFQNSNDAIALLNEEGKYVWQNRANYLLHRLSDSELSQLTGCFHVNKTEIKLKKELDKINEFSGIFDMPLGKNSQKIWLSAFRIHDELNNTLCYVEMKRHAKEYLLLLEKTKEEKELLEKKSYTDFLTQVYNREGFLKALQSRTYREQGCIIFIDIDHFKKINDQYGHDMGDKILASVALLLTHKISSEHITARWGGEEFIIWIDESFVITQRVCEELRVAMSHSFPYGHEVTCSFGIAPMKSSLNESISNADEAMYHAKHQGRNCVISYVSGDDGRIFVRK